MLFSDLLHFCHSPEDNGGTSGPADQADDSSGDSGNDSDTSDDDADDKPAHVPRGTYEKAVREAQNARKRAQELEAAERKRQEDDLKKKGDLQALLDAKDAELEEYKGKLSSFESAINEGRKENALRKAIGKALDPKWDRLLSSFVDQVVIDGEGKIDSKSAKKLADDFSREFPEAFGEVRTPGAPPTKGGSNGSLTVDQWKAMPNGPEKRAAMAKVIE